jgi:DNA-binding GntR family transcriptional regulator
VNTGLREATASRPPDLVRVQELHARFHRTFTNAAAGPRLLGELNVLQPQAERYERVYTSGLVFAYEEALQEHDAIISALLAGDPDAAEDAVSRNWRGGAHRYGQAVAILGERGNW